MQQPPMQPDGNQNQPPMHMPQGNQPYPAQAPFPPNTPYPQQPSYPPNTPYPYAQSMYAPAGPAPAQKKSRRRLLIAGIVILVALFACIGISSLIAKGGTTSATTSTDSSTTSNAASSNKTASGTGSSASKPQTWTVVQTFKDNGSKKTASFSVPDHWKLSWSCNPASFDGIGQYNVIATVEGSDGSIVDTGVNAMCKAGSTSGETDIYTAGDNVHLNVLSEGDWTFTIKELK